MTRVQTARQQQYIQAFIFKGEFLLKEAFAPDRREDASDTRLDQLSMALDAATAVTVLAGLTLAPPTLGVALLGAGAGVVILQAANGVVKVVQRHVDSQSVPITDETHWDADFLTWRICLREVAEGAAYRYRHFINEMIEARSIVKFAHVGAERVIKKIKESPGISPSLLIEHLMLSAKLPLTHASEKVFIKSEYAPASLLASNDAHAKWVYARSRMMVCQKTAPFTISYRFYSSPQERMYLQTWTTVPHYGYLSEVAADLSTEITRHHRSFVALTDTREIEAQVNHHLCIYYPVTWDEMSIYLEDARADIAAGRVKRSLNQYLADRLSVKIIAQCHGDVLKGRDLSGGDFSEINGRDLDLEGCNLNGTHWRWAHLERTQFKGNEMSGASFQEAFLERSTWTDVVLTGDFSHARMNGATLTRCVISARLQDRGCVWDGTVLDGVQMEPGLEETLKQYVDEQRETLQKDFEILSRRCEENATALLARNQDACQALQNEMRLLEQKRALSGVQHDFEIAQLKTQYSVLSEVAQKQQYILDDVLEQAHHLQDEVTELKERPLHALREQMRLHIENLFDDAMLQFYVDLNVVSSGTGATQSFPLWDRLDQYIDDPQERFFLLHGDIGSGKSMSVLRFAQQLAQQHWHAEDWFPVYIQLKQINDRSTGNFLDAALRTIFSPELIAVLKDECRCVIILDGLDECGIDFSQRALLEECGHTAHQWARGMPKIIVTTQTRCLIDRNYHQLLRIAPDIYFPRQSEYAIQPLNDAQIESYLRSYYPNGMNVDALGTSLAEINAMAKSPIMLHIICVVLQASEEHALWLNSRVAFYDAFFFHWGKHISPKILTDHFNETSIKKYCRRIAYQMFVEGTDCIDRPYQLEEKEALQLEEDRRLALLNPQSFTSMFDNPVWKKAGSLTPMSAILLDDRLPAVVRHTFVHKSFQYYALAQALIDMLLENSPTERLVNWNYSFLTDTLSVFDFLHDIIQAHPQKKAMLMALKDMVKASSAANGSQWSKVASNAITLLNVLRFDFSAHLQPSEWRGIHVPRANLNGALLASVDLSNSDLSFVVFENAVLAACDISHSNLAGTCFSDTQLFGFTKKPPTFVAVFPSDTWIVTYDGGKDADTKEHKIVNASLDGANYPDFSGHDDEIRVGVWGLSNGERRFASAGEGGTVRVQQVSGNGLRGAEIAKLKDGVSGAILSLSWSKDGNILAAGGAYSRIRIWNVDKNKCEAVPFIHGGAVRAVLFGQIMPFLLSAGDDKKVRLWTVSIEARYLKSMSKNPKEKQFPAAIHALALSVCEDAFAAGCADGNIYLYQTERASFEQATEPRSLIGHSDTVTSVIWNAWRLVSASNDSTVRVWDVANRVCVSAFQGDRRPVKQVAWLPGRRHVIAGGGGKSRMLFVVDTDEQSNASPAIEGMTHRVTCIAPYGKYLATGSLDGRVWLWNIKTVPVNRGRQVIDHEGTPVIQIEWSQDGQYIASRSSRDIRIRERVLGMDGEILRSNGWGVIPLDSNVLFNHMTWFNDLASGQPWLAIGGSDGKIHLWKRSLTTGVDTWISSGSIVWGVSMETRPIHCVAAAPSRRRILDSEIPSMSTLSGATASHSAVLGLDDLKDTALNPVNIHSGLAAADDLNVLSLTPESPSRSPLGSNESGDSVSACPPFSSSGVSTSGGSNTATNWLAASRGPAVRIWDLRQEGEAVCVQECLGKGALITVLLWSPDGRLLASIDEQQAVWVWETSDWSCVFKDEQSVGEKHMSWAIIGEDKQWLVLGALDEIRIFDASQQFAMKRPVKSLSWGADKIGYHAGLLFLVQNRSVDMINLIALMFDEASTPFWMGRIGHGLCMQGCVATDAQNLSPVTKAFIKNLGAEVSEDIVETSWRFWQRHNKKNAVTAFPAFSEPLPAAIRASERSPALHTQGLFATPRHLVPVRHYQEGGVHAPSL